MLDHNNIPMYQLQIQIPLEAMDDIQAREKARKVTKELASSIEQVLKGTETTVAMKLQKLYLDKPPKGIRI